MRVLAIRGENLASLTFPFEVDLERPPLAGAGLFAISGPTGAGKSTLLDALCLALFDAVPRLTEGSSAPVGSEDEPEEARLSANDVRSILTRGAGQGHAEVDFVGNDGRRYRARWEVRRARGKASGRYQPQTLSLRELETGIELGRTKTETLEEISERIGLTFEQFRRAALLAQGDFAAFLKAKERERSELLERITGTEIYGLISKAAHVRASEEAQALRDVQTRLDAVSPLAPDRRAALEQEVAGARGVLEAAERDLSAAKSHQAWCERFAELESATAQAAEGLAGASGAVAQAAARWQTVREVEAAEPLRRLVDDADRACREQDAAAAQLADARQHEEEAQAEATAAEQSGRAAETARQSVDEALGAVRPELEEARRLDTRLADCRARLEQARKDAEAALAVSREAEAQRSARAARRADLVAVRDGEAEWLQAHASLVPLVAEWGRWSEAMERYARGQAAAREAEARLQGLAAEQAKAGRDLDDARARQGATAAELQGACSALQRVEAECAGYDLAGLRAEETTLVERQTEFAELQQCAREVEGRTATRNRLLQEADGLEVQAAEAEEQARVGRTAIAAKEAAIAEARAARDRLLAASTKNADDLRHHLVPGEPCPVCGARDHPWGAAHPAFEPLRRDADARLQGLEGERTALVTEQAEGATAAREKRQQAGERRASAGQVQTDLTTLAAEWLSRYSAHDLPADPLDPAVGGALAGRIAEVNGALGELRQRLTAAVECQRRREAATAERDAARKADDGAREAVADLQQRLQDVEHTLALEGQTRLTAMADVDQARSILATPLASSADWEGTLSADPAAFRSACEARVAGWQAHERGRAEAERALSDLAPQLAEAETTARSTGDQARRAEAEAEGQAGERVRLGAARQGLLGGREADHVEAEMQERQRTALSAHQQAAARVADARSALAAARVSAQHRADEAARKGTECAEARRVLAAALSARGLVLDTVRQLLAHESAWVRAEREALESLKRTEQDARVLADERRRQLDVHAATRPEGLDCTGVARVLGEAQAQHAQAQSGWAAVEGRLQDDDRRRQEAGALAEELAAREASARVWEELRDLVGSADGNKFRTFAQSLTLDALLDHANRHLEDLARRYRLERSPGSDLALQVVDADMGDEVRSVYSLSGGESFLVSLALALGLASLASHRTSVESLFIDEGFGSLDPETLDTAIASLDALQALGRKVGVISHVPTMVERIGVQVRIEPRGGGRSRVRTLSREDESV